MVVLTSKSVRIPGFTFKYNNSMSPQMLFCWTSFAMLVVSTLLLALPHESQAAAISIPISEMLREAEEPFERDDRDYRPLQFGKRDSFRPLQFGKKSVYRPLQFGKRGGAHYWPVDDMDSHNGLGLDVIAME